MWSRSLLPSARCFTSATGKSILKGKSILVSNSISNDLPKPALSYLQEELEVDVLPLELDRQKRYDGLLKQLKSKKYDGLLIGLEDKIDEPMVKVLQPKCKVISTMSVGYNHIDLATCKQHNIWVANTPGVLTETTADLVITLMLMTARKAIEANAAVYNGEWGMWRPLWMCGKDLHHSRVGLVGMGRIGLAVTKRLSGFSCDVTYCNKSQQPNPMATQLGAKFSTFQAVLEHSDFVVPLCPLTNDTKFLFSKREFEQMKKDAIFINASRGDVVDQPALVEALKQKHIAAAGLDVTTPEPLPLQHDLLKLNNVTILPHIGSASVQTRTEMAMVTAKNIIFALQNQPKLGFFVQ